MVSWALEKAADVSETYVGPDEPRGWGGNEVDLAYCTIKKKNYALLTENENQSNYYIILFFHFLFL